MVYYFWTQAKSGKLQELLDHAQWCVDVCKEHEPNTLRFDWYTDPENENALYVYEAYTDEAGFKEHQKNEPYKLWASGRAKELTDDFKVIFVSSTVSTTAE